MEVCDLIPTNRMKENNIVFGLYVVVTPGLEHLYDADQL